MDRVKGRISENGIGGFRKSGTCPLDFEQIIDCFPQAIQNQPKEKDNVHGNFNDAFVSYLQALRPKQEAARQKENQINIEPGKSIHAEDLQQINDEARPSGLQAPPKKRGRPKSIQPAVNDQEAEPPKKRGRPKSIQPEVNEQEAGPPKKRGRPKSIQPEVNDQEAGPLRKRGRPKSTQPTVNDQEAEPPRKRGRPKSAQSTVDNQEASSSDLQAPRKSKRIKTQQAQTTWPDSESELDFHASDNKDSDL